MKLTESQEAGVDMIESATGVVRLLGPAGSGKTTILNSLRGYSAKLAPTNKAAMLIGGQTIHKFLGLKMVRKDGEMFAAPTKKTPVHPMRDRIIIDEASCIPRHILEKYVIPLMPKAVLVGDHAQLTPVKESTIPFMDLDCPTTELQYTHRFGGELLDAANIMRQAVLTGSDFEVPSKWDIDQDELLATLGEDDTIGAWRNDTVDYYNNLVRKYKYNSPDWQAGEKVRIGSYYFKGQIPTESEFFITSVDSSRSCGLHTWIIGIGDLAVEVVHAEDRDEYKEKLAYLADNKDWRAFYALQDSFCDLRASYAATIHKLQGSTYANAFVDFADIFDNPKGNEACRAGYVGTTRAQLTCRSIQS